MKLEQFVLFGIDKIAHYQDWLWLLLVLNSELYNSVNVEMKYIIT